jgi:hypothetical protein
MPSCPGSGARRKGAAPDEVSAVSCNDFNIGRRRVNLPPLRRHVGGTVSAFGHHLVLGESGAAEDERRSSSLPADPADEA